MSEHYFAPQPASNEKRTAFTVRLAGRELTVSASSGVFSSQRLDPGTAVLLSHAEDLPESGTFVDLGSGWGPIALSMAVESPQAHVVAIEINERARELTAENAQRAGVNVKVLDPEQAMAEVPSIDVLWSNPPIRVGKQALHELLGIWLPRLSDNGRAELVVSKNLGADSLQRWIQDELGLECERTASSKGFRILRVSRPNA